MSERKSCVYSHFASAYVERLTFSDSGVNIEFTKEECRAARVLEENVAIAMAISVPGGSTMVHSGAKPPMESELRRIEAESTPTERERRLEEVLRRIANGEYDNAHDCKAASHIARAALTPKGKA